MERPQAPNTRHKTGLQTQRIRPGEKVLDNLREIYRLNAPAKLNLGLRVVGRRSDGYHELQSLFWPIALEDTLEVQASTCDTLEVITDRKLPSGLGNLKENLIFRARDLCAPSHSLKVRLRKQIPIGGGLGGGSSDAAAILRAFGCDLSPDLIARELGADIPFFLNPRPSWVEGIGEKIHVIDVAEDIYQEMRFLIVMPNFSVPTKVVFSKYASAGLKFSDPIDCPQLTSWEDFENYLSYCENDLERVSCENFSALKDILRRLRLVPQILHAGISGTGSTCFGVFRASDEYSIKEFMNSFRWENCQTLITQSHRIGDT